MAFVLTVDQRASRSSPDRVPEVLRKLNGAVPTVLGFERTAGDEFQGVLSDPDELEHHVDDVVRVREDTLELVPRSALEAQYGRDGGVQPPEHLRNPVGAAATGPLIDRQDKRHLARLTAFLARCKPQSLSATSGGNPPVAIGPQPVIVTRSRDFPWRVIAARYSSQSGCSPLIER